MHAAISAETPIWGEPEGLLGAAALAAMALLNRGQNRAALALLDPRAGEYVLEIGYGPGASLGTVAARVGPQGFVAGVDSSRTAARMAARGISGSILRGRAFVMQASVEHMNFRDSLFDKVFAVNSFGFWPQPARALTEIARVLRPGGRLVLTQRGANPERPTHFAGAAEGFDRIAQAAKLLRNAGWTLMDERADRDGPRLMAVSVVARAPR